MRYLAKLSFFSALFIISCFCSTSNSFAVCDGTVCCPYGQSRGCDGICGSGKVYDRCGVCGGFGNTCMTPAPSATKTPFGYCAPPKTVDICGVCGGTGSSCAGCDGVFGSNKVIDRCGVCGGTNACLGCDGVPYSGKVLDACGVCGGQGYTCRGCCDFGQVKDACGVCGGANACLGCDGVPNSGKSVDICGVCGGGNFCGNDGIDACGVQGGDGSQCCGCDNVQGSNKKVDLCGICGGDNSCVGCDGQPYSGVTIDGCGVCGGNDACRTPKDCKGVPGGTATIGPDGICRTPEERACLATPTPTGTAVKTATPTPTPTKTTESQPLTTPTPTSTATVTVTPGVRSTIQPPGTPTPTNTATITPTPLNTNAPRPSPSPTSGSIDCEGTPGGTKKIDQCGVCGGNNTSCTGCDGIPNSGAKVNSCGVCAPETECKPNGPCRSQSIKELLVVLDNSSLDLKRALNKALKSLDATTSGKPADKYIKLARARGAGLQHDAWSAGWSYPVEIKNCDASPTCIKQDISSSGRNYLSNLTQLVELANQVAKKLRATKNAKAKRDAEVLVNKVQNIFTRATNEVRKLPNSTTSCN